jgi:hypothetical protein
VEVDVVSLAAMLYDMSEDAETMNTDEATRTSAVLDDLSGTNPTGDETMEDSPLGEALREILGDESAEDSAEESTRDQGNLGEGESSDSPAEEPDEQDLLEQLSTAYGTDDIVQAIINARKTGLRTVPRDLADKHNIKLELGHCEVRNDWLYVNNRLYVPHNEKLRTRIIHEIHTSLPRGHAGRESTYARMHREYYWPRMTNSVARYVKSCHVCK